MLLTCPLQNVDSLLMCVIQHTASGPLIATVVITIIEYAACCVMLLDSMCRDSFAAGLRSPCHACSCRLTTYTLCTNLIDCGTESCNCCEGLCTIVCCMYMRGRPWHLRVVVPRSLSLHIRFWMRQQWKGKGRLQYSPHVPSIGAPCISQTQRTNSFSRRD
jgi:hypothetical protein